MPIFMSQHPELDRAFDLVQTEPETSLQLCNDFLKQNPGHSLGLLRKFFALKGLKDWPAALSVNDEIIKSNPNNCQAHNDASVLHYRLHDYSKAVDSAHKALAVDEDKWLGTIPYRLLAASHAQLGELPIALSYADHAHAIDPSPFIPYGPLPAGTISQFKQYLTKLARRE